MKNNITIMKNLVKRNKWIGIICLLLCGIYSCQNDDYLIDGGTSSPYFDGNVMEFLESRPDLFKDMVTVIKYADMESLLRDEEVTFFAPTDFSIEKSVERLNEYLYRYGKDKITDLRQVKPEVWKDLLSMYVMKGKYRMNDIAQIDTTALSAFPGQTNFTYYRNYKMTMGVVYGDAGGIKYAGARQVMYIYPSNGFRLTSYVSTCNIEPLNGIVHVIRLDHYLGFIPSSLLQKAIEEGIDYDWNKNLNAKKE